MCPSLIVIENDEQITWTWWQGSAVADPVEVVPSDCRLHRRVRDSAAERIGICRVSIRSAVARQIPMTAERIVKCDVYRKFCTG